MKESIGFDLEYQAPGPITPSRIRHAATMIVVLRRSAEYREAPEAVFAREVGGRRIQSAPLQGLPECELVPNTKRRVRFLICADVITVPPAQCTIARVKLISHVERCRDPYVGREHCVQRAPQLLNVPAPTPSLRNSNAYCLASRVNSGIGSPGS